MLIERKSVQTIMAGLSAAGRGGLPILEHALVIESEGSASVTTTDLELQITATLAEQDGPNGLGGYCVHAGKLREILRSGSPPITITHDNSRAIVRSGAARFTVNTLHPDEFPALQTVGGQQLAIPADTLRLGIASVIDAAARDDVRHYLNGVLMELKHRRLTLIATDGHRMHVWRADIDAELEVNAIIPRRSAEALTRQLQGTEMVTVEVSRTALSVACGPILITTKLIDAKYPDWERAIQDTNRQITVNRGDLLAAVNRANILANEQYYGLSMTVQDSGHILIESASVNGATSELISIQEGAVPHIFAHNGHYLRDAASLFPHDELSIQYSDNTDHGPIIMTPPDACYPMALVMGIRL